MEEKRLKHEISFWKEDLPKDVDHPMNYSVPDFGVDQDIKYTQNNIKQAEKSLDADWKMPKDGYTVGWANTYVQTGAESEA